MYCLIIWLGGKLQGLDGKFDYVDGNLHSAACSIGESFLPHLKRIPEEYDIDFHIPSLLTSIVIDNWLN